MMDPHSPRQNHLFALLPQAAYARLRPHLELIPMPLGDVITNSGSGSPYVYFPVSCIISMLYITKDGASSEIATVGNEGMVGIAHVLGGGTTNTSASVNHAGYAFRLKASVLQEEWARNQAVQNVLLHYAQALLTQIAQVAVCNRHHTISQQLCHWLLLRLDRLSSNQIKATHGLVAVMLGVRREGVTAAMGQLLSAGLIRSRRGHITVMDRDGLEEKSCECYAVVKDEFFRLLPGGLQHRDWEQSRELGKPLAAVVVTRTRRDNGRAPSAPLG